MLADLKPQRDRRCRAARSRSGSRSPRPSRGAPRSPPPSGSRGSRPRAPIAHAAPSSQRRRAVVARLHAARTAVRCVSSSARSSASFGPANSDAEKHDREHRMDHEVRPRQRADVDHRVDDRRAIELARADIVGPTDPRDQRRARAAPRRAASRSAPTTAAATAASSSSHRVDRVAVASTRQHDVSPGARPSTRSA